MLNHAFVLSVHTNPDQIKLLVKTLLFGDVFIHVDKKQESLFQQLKDYYAKYENVHVIENRISVNWSGLSQVIATLNLLEAVKSMNKNYDYVHFISGQDLLLLSQKELDSFIQQKKKKEFIEVNKIGNYKWRLKQYSFFRENPNNRKIFFRLLDIFIRVIQLPFIHRKNLDSMDLYKGSQWFSITYPCALYVLEQSLNYIDDFKFTACPDEHFFQVLIMNSNFKNSVDCNNYRYIVFDGLNTSPKTLTLEDFEKFMNGNYMFARKFDSNVDNMVIKKVLEKQSGGDIDA